MKTPVLKNLFPLRVNYIETYSVALTFESVDEILWCDHSNETSSAVLLHGTIGFLIFYEIKFGVFLGFLFFGSLCSERVKGCRLTWLMSSTCTCHGHRLQYDRDLFHIIMCIRKVFENMNESNQESLKRKKRLRKSTSGSYIGHRYWSQPSNIGKFLASCFLNLLIFREIYKEVRRLVYFRDSGFRL